MFILDLDRPETGPVLGGFDFPPGSGFYAGKQSLKQSRLAGPLVGALMQGVRRPLTISVWDRTAAAMITGQYVEQMVASYDTRVF